MNLNVMDKLVDVFMEYTNKYDENIKKLINEKNVEVSSGQLDEILQDAKYLLEDDRRK